MSAALRKLAEQKGTQKEEEKKPTHFDLEPIQKALKRFLLNNCESRSNMRTLFVNNSDVVNSVFKDMYEENSFKRCIDIHEMAGKLSAAGLNLEPHHNDNLGGLLLCFGNIDHDRLWGERVPPETEEQKRAKMLLDMRKQE